MPIYVYQVIEEDGSDGEIFEIQQSMNDEALSTHPDSGKPVRRVYLPPNISTKYGEKGMSGKLEKSNLEKHGFTRYEKDPSTGTYHKTAGKEGPGSFTP